ncbi:MAG: hypothetical protein HC785_18415, partial [Calothrix sp. CSU_2_0]|nr:hypothetical protein [Calothrix sp. CSU_2_0]
PPLVPLWWLFLIMLLFPAFLLRSLVLLRLCLLGKAGGRRQKAEGRRQKAEGRRQKAGGRRQEAEGEK